MGESRGLGDGRIDAQGLGRMRSGSNNSLCDSPRELTFTRSPTFNCRGADVPHLTPEAKAELLKRRFYSFVAAATRYTLYESPK